MGNTNVVDQGQHLQGECHGQESSLMKKLSLFFHLPSLMVLNGLNCKNFIIIIFVVYILSMIFFVEEGDSNTKSTIIHVDYDVRSCSSF